MFRSMITPFIKEFDLDTKLNSKQLVYVSNTKQQSNKGFQLCNIKFWSIHKEKMLTITTAFMFDSRADVLVNVSRF